MKKLVCLLVVSYSLLMAGCGGGESTVDTTEETGTGRFVLEVTDAPVDNAAAVVIEYTGVEIKPENGPAVSYDFDSPKRLDLIAITEGGVPQELLNENIDEGHYLWFRLKVNAEVDDVFDSYIELKDGRQFELSIPSGSETGLKVNEAFDLVKNSGYGFLLDFDLRKSIVESGDSYLLKPVIRSIAYTTANLLAVEIAPEIIAEECDDESTYAGAVYLFSGTNAALDDVDSSDDAAPFLTVPVSYSSSEDQDLETQYDAYFARFWSLPSSAYTVAFTCDPSDDPEQDDPDLVFAAETINVAADIFDEDLNVIVKLENRL